MDQNIVINCFAAFSPLASLKWGDLESLASSLLTGAAGQLPGDICLHHMSPEVLQQEETFRIAGLRSRDLRPQVRDKTPAAERKERI